MFVHKLRTPNSGVGWKLISYRAIKDIPLNNLSIQPRRNQSSLFPPIIKHIRFYFSIIIISLFKPKDISCWGVLISWYSCYLWPRVSEPDLNACICPSNSDEFTVVSERRHTENGLGLIVSEFVTFKLEGLLRSAMWNWLRSVLIFHLTCI